MSENQKRDFRRELTDRIIDLMEKGTAPWQKPWNADTAASLLELPHNAVTGRAYRGGNAVWLMAQSMANEVYDPRYATYKQAAEMGWQVRKGERGTSVEYWQFDKEETRKNPTSGLEEKIKVKLESPRVFYASVFHASQIDGIPPYEPKSRGNDWEPIAQAETILTNSNARIYHDQTDKAFYSPGRDSIHLPPKEAYPNAMNYYEVAMHELGHWSGHNSRLDRDLTGSFGSASYAKEELRAQMASLFIAADTGVPFNPDRHASYQASWIAALKDDKNEFYRAAKDAEVISDFVLEFAKEKKVEVTKAATSVDNILNKASELLKDHPAMANPATKESVLGAIEKRIQESLVIRPQKTKALSQGPEL